MVKVERAKSSKIGHDANEWRRFLSDAPPIDELIEIRRLHDNKTILRRRADLPPGFLYNKAEWRPFRDNC